MQKHLLLEKAYVYPLSTSRPELKGCEFDYRNGYWVLENSAKPYVLDKSYGSPPRTKKCDVETGEDQKGE